MEGDKSKNFRINDFLRRLSENKETLISRAVGGVKGWADILENLE